MGKALEIIRTTTTAPRCGHSPASAATAHRFAAFSRWRWYGRPSRSIAASANGMDRQTLSDWVHRYNDEGWMA